MQKFYIHNDRLIVKHKMEFVTIHWVIMDTITFNYLYMSLVDISTNSLVSFYANHSKNTT